METIILANGEFPQRKQVRDLLQSAGRVVCCDGAVENLLQTGREPDIIIGDLDSISRATKARFQDRLVQVDDQDTNDLTKAVNWCIDRGIDKVVILGATGKREDHSLGNISLLLEYIPKIEVEIRTDYGCFIPLTKAQNTIKTFMGQQVSVFSLNTRSEFTSEGLKYPLNKMRLDSWWKGTLNEAVSDEIRINISGEPFTAIVYLLGWD